MSSEIILLLGACAIAVYTDVRERKIPNLLTASLAGGALALHIPAGLSAVAGALAAGVVIFLLGTVAHRARILGGGDVKLLAAGGIALAYPNCAAFIIYTFLGGGVLAIVFALAQGRLRTSLVNIRVIAQTRTLLGDSPASARMPYAIAIALGAVAVALANTILPAMRFPS